MDRFLESAVSFFLGRKRRVKKQKHTETQQPGIGWDLKSSCPDDLVVDKPQNEKEGKLKDKGKLFVGGLNYATTSTELSVYFSKFGDVINSVVIKCPTTGKSRGFGFVTFLNPADAEKALKESKHVLDGRTIECRPFDSKEDSKETKAKRSKEARVFLGGLPDSVTKEELQQFFSRYGEVTNVILPIDKNTKKGKGFAFLFFENEDVAEKCIAERFVYLKERRIHIKKAKSERISPNVRQRAEDAPSSSNLTDQDSFDPEDSASLPDEDTQSSSSGQLNFELEQHPELQRLFEDYFAEKLTYFSGMSGKEVENRKQQLQNNDMENLEKFLRGVSLNSGWDLDEDSDSESADSDTSDDSCEIDCENHFSLPLSRGEFGECASKNSAGKKGSNVTLPFEKERSDLNFPTQEFTQDGLNKSSAAMSFKKGTGIMTCKLCEWTSPNFETFLAHCKTASHRTKLMQRFSESEAQEVKIEPKLYQNNEEQKDSPSEVISYPKVTGVHLEGLQRQNSGQEKIKKMQKTHGYLQDLPEEPVCRQPVNQEVQKAEKVQKQKRQKKKKKEQKVLNSVQESITERVPNFENESNKQNSHQKRNDKMNNPNLKIYALAKGMACIQPLSENKLKCEMCNKIIPESLDIGVLMRNVSQHLQSKRHLQKLLETEDKFKSLDSKNLEPGKNSVDEKNLREESSKGKNIPTKKKYPKDQGSLSASKASLVEEKTALKSNKNNPKVMGNNPKNAAPKKEKAKTDDSKIKVLCLQCNFSKSTFEEFALHLESERHSGTSTSSVLSLKAKNADYTKCNFCNAYLFGSLYDINVHFSKHFS